MAVFRRIRDLLGGGETQYLITYTAISDWISAEEAKARDTLGDSVVAPRAAIEASVAHLRGIVDDLAASEVDEPLHARLEKIVRTSVPLFTKSMQTSLARPFPDDPEGFYAAVAELLKGCLAAMRGPGRYLRAAFPEEMKEVRMTLDAIGRETNAITQSIALFRREIAAVGAVRTGFEALERARADRAAACTRIDASEAAATTVRIQLDEAEEATRRLENDPAYQDARDREKQLLNLEEEGKQIEREYRALAASMTHVFRKAGNIGSRRGDAAAGKTFAEAIRMLEWFPHSEEEGVSHVLAAAVPEMLGLVGEGLLELKNKEEKALFSDSEAPAKEVLAVIGRYRVWEARFRAEQSALIAAPALAAARDLDARKNVLSSEITSHLHARNVAADQFARAEATIPTLEKTLCQALARRLARPIVLEIDTRRLECLPQ